MGERMNPNDVLRVRREQPTRLEGFVDSAFAFAVTLIVISIGHVPEDVPEMLQALRGLPTFAVCFLLIARFWQMHRFWGRHYDIEDRTSVRLSLVLVFLVLVYVYPLRLLFSFTFSSMTDGWLVEKPIDLHTIGELRAAYIVFGIGLASIATVFALLFLHALKCAGTIGLSADEIIVTRVRVAGWVCTIVVALLSIASAVFIPFDVRMPWLFAVPGCMYWLLMLTRPMMDRIAARQIAAPRQ
ncbi:MAG TPA: TMEM175 family protein [Rudaea sp.]|jgi:hypothetical protein|nr:TMEM175 family protein [Rudaea sp.]